MKALIHFAHGNGFPGLCYRQFLEALSPQFDYCTIDMVGHNPALPVTEHWENLVLELIYSIESQADRPVIAVGHSLGGVLSLLAAIERPDLIKSVVLLDSPLLGRFKSSMVRLAKALGFIDRITPALQTRGRREHWKNRDLLEKYLQSRDLFKTFSPACLQDYIDYGLEKTEQGYYLRFDRHIESQIYRTIPHRLHQYVGRLKVPAALLYGSKSTVVDRLDIRHMKKFFGIHAVLIEGTHMFPMEDPELSAQKVINVIEKLLRTVDE